VVFAVGDVEGGVVKRIVVVGSEVASRLCATKILDLFEEAHENAPERAFLPETVQGYVHAAHNYVADYKEHNPEIKSSCTTVACFVTNGATAVMSHIGDTRIYLFRNGKLVFQTRDHSLSQVAVEMGQISLRDIRTHKDQNKLTRVLGNDYYIEPDCEVVREPLIAGDAVILCTDGFWEYVYEEEMEFDVAASAAPDEALARMESRLLARVGKFNDNYSAVVAFVSDN
ncbi:MAG: serine/threonine-protein phosphatase, partial [Clostridiales bacterium]|nr:serine/threonine-protein phosphatase [Clostridiales bacterium]